MPKSSENARWEKMDAQIKKTLKPAEVVFKVTGFKDVLTVGAPAARSISLSSNMLSNCRGTSATMALSKRHPRVRIKPKEPATLRIKAPGATIRFTVTPGEYYPIGIAFWLLEGASKPSVNARLGLLDIEPCEIRRFGHVLYITDTFKNQEPYARYKFSVIIQRANDGALGIIDPDIIHES
jgi:hypothetical protein